MVLAAFSSVEREYDTRESNNPLSLRLDASDSLSGPWRAAAFPSASPIGRPRTFQRDAAHRLLLPTFTKIDPPATPEHTTTTIPALRVTTARPNQDLTQVCPLFLNTKYTVDTLSVASTIFRRGSTNSETRPPWSLTSPPPPPSP